MDNKVGIVTIIDNNNYGNRLQNYAVQTILNHFGLKNESINNSVVLNKKEKYILRRIKYLGKDIYNSYDINYRRQKSFLNFNAFMNITLKKFTIYSKYKYDYLIVGSDQVWNPNFGRLSDLDLLNVKCKNDTKKIAFSASFGVNELPNHLDKRKLLKCFNDFDAISVREDAGKEILKDLGYKGEVAVLVDPTMLLTASEWDEVSKKPEMLKTDKYILNYFLGDLSKERMDEIQRVAKENDCEVINILDKNSPFYECGPSEFLYLEKHAFLICTDSFHSSVFAVLYNRPFIVFDREQENVVNMNSRLDTLISKLKLENRKYNGKCITYENMNHDYTEAYKQLEIERKKSINFLKNALKENINEN